MEIPAAWLLLVCSQPGTHLLQEQELNVSIKYWLSLIWGDCNQQLLSESINTQKSKTEGHIYCTDKRLRFYHKLQLNYVYIKLHKTQTKINNTCTFSSYFLLIWATCTLPQISHFSGIGEDSWQFGQLLPFCTSGTALLKRQLVLTTATVVKVGVYWTAILFLMWISDNPTFDLTRTQPYLDSTKCLYIV